MFPVLHCSSAYYTNIYFYTQILNTVRRPVHAVKRAHVTMLPLTLFASREIPILWVEVVRKIVNVPVTLPNVHLLLKKRTAQLVMKTRIHALMAHAQVS